jgi:hypothetical protein
MKFNNYSKLNFSDTNRQLNKINEFQIQLRNSYMFQMGSVLARDFSEDCERGDWEFFEIAFESPFPTDQVRVIVTANGNAAAVAIAQHVGRKGFILAARNSGCAPGTAGFNWMAFVETPEERQRPVGLRMGVVQPRHFMSDCEEGDWRSWEVMHSPVRSEPFTLLTACNGNAAAVGVVNDSRADGFTFSARNSGCAEGDSSFYYLVLTQYEDKESKVFVDGGEVPAQHFAPDCVPGDWQSWEIQFKESFLTPPIVLITAGGENANAAVVGIAQNVTTHGFTLSARNSGCAEGDGGFYWAAFGCAKGCGD